MYIWQRLRWLIADGCWIDSGWQHEDSHWRIGQRRISSMTVSEHPAQLDTQRPQPQDWTMASSNDQQTQQRPRILVPDTDLIPPIAFINVGQHSHPPPTQLLHQAQPGHHISSKKRTLGFHFIRRIVMMGKTFSTLEWLEQSLDICDMDEDHGPGFDSVPSISWRRIWGSSQQVCPFSHKDTWSYITTRDSWSTKVRGKGVLRYLWEMA